MKLYEEYLQSINEKFEFKWSKGNEPPEIPQSEYEDIEIPDDLLYKDKIGMKVNNILTRKGRWSGYNVDPDKKDLFLKKIIFISEALGIHPNWLMDIIRYETASTFSSRIKNPKSSATGLIQFMDMTARGSFGLDSSGDIPTDPIRQLDYVFAYILRFKGDKKIDSVYDLYMIVFTPGYFNKPDDFKYSQKYIKANRGNFGYFPKGSKYYGTIKDIKNKSLKKIFPRTATTTGSSFASSKVKRSPSNKDSGGGYTLNIDKEITSPTENTPKKEETPKVTLFDHQEIKKWGTKYFQEIDPNKATLA